MVLKIEIVLNDTEKILSKTIAKMSSIEIQNISPKERSCKRKPSKFEPLYS
jgi:hypothetical protein